MKIDVRSTSRMPSNHVGDVIALLVLAGELIAFVQWTGTREWFRTVVRSEAGRVFAYAAVFIALSIWGLAVWPRIHGAISWMACIVCFGVIGALFLYLSIVRNYGRGFSFIYGPLFVGQAMIGVAGLARLMATHRRQRMRHDSVAHQRSMEEIKRT